MYSIMHEKNKYTVTVKKSLGKNAMYTYQFPVTTAQFDAWPCGLDENGFSALKTQVNRTSYGVFWSSRLSLPG